MIFLIYYVIGWVVGLVVAFATGSMTNVSSASQTLLLYHLTVTVGLTGILGGYGHLFMGDRIAKSIGWPTGSLFQVELGYCCLGMGVLGVMCFWYRDNFWLATIVFTTVFMVGAALLHAKEMIQKGNFNPGNAITTLPDLLIPATLFILWFLAKG
jgi:hypothetical protein